jgi:hypothetical protein
MVGTNDVTNKKQTEKIQKSYATRVSGGHDHNHAVVTRFTRLTRAGYRNFEDEAPALMVSSRLQSFTINIMYTCGS